MAQRRSQPVILIAPEPLSRTLRAVIESECDVSLEIYDSVHRFDRTRQDRPTIRDHVLDALLEIDRSIAGFSSELRGIFLKLLDEPTAPDVKLLGEWAGSRSSLYRWWREHLPEMPAAFLGRVRRLHAESLLEKGCSMKEAAWRAGYSSPSRLSRVLARYRGTE